MKMLVFILILIFGSFLTYCQTDSITFDYGRNGIGADLGPCTGLGFMTGNAKENFHCDCFANIGIIYSRDKIHYILRMTGMSGNLKKDLSFGSEWKQNYDFNSMDFELAMGYQVIDIKRFNVIPMISGGLKSFNVRENYEANVTRTKFTGTISAALAIDLKLHSPIKAKNKYPGSDFTIQYWYIRLIGGIYPQYFDKPLDVNGGIYYLNISIGGYFKPRRTINGA